MIAKGLLPESEHHHSFNSDLPHALEALGSEKLPEAHGESRGQGLVALLFLHGVESDSVLDEQKRFIVGLG